MPSQVITRTGISALTLLLTRTHSYVWLTHKCEGLCASVSELYGFSHFMYPWFICNDTIFKTTCTETPARTLTHVKNYKPQINQNRDNCQAQVFSLLLFMQSKNKSCIYRRNQYKMRKQEHKKSTYYRRRYNKQTELIHITHSLKPDCLRFLVPLQQLSEIWIPKNMSREVVGPTLVVPH